MFTLDETYVHFTSNKFRAVVQYIQDTIALSPYWLRHIWGDSRLTHWSIYTIVKLAIKRRLYIATDALVKQGHAAYSFCFADKKKRKVIFKSGSKVEGPLKHITSYGAEMALIIAALHVVDTILSTVGVTKIIVPLYTDSESFILTSKNHCLKSLHYVISNDIDVVLQLNKSIKACSQSIC